MARRFVRTAAAFGAAALTTSAADAQSLGTFRWQLQPFCNVVTVNVIQQGAVYTLDGSTTSAAPHSGRPWSAWPRRTLTARSASGSTS